MSAGLKGKMKIGIIEDNKKLREGLSRGLSDQGVVVIFECASGEEALEYCNQQPPDALLMDVQLDGQWNGIQATVAIRREWPRIPVVFYSIQDDEQYFLDFLNSGILSHFAYVRKSNYLLPEMIVPLLEQARSGRSFFDPEIQERMEESRYNRAHSPLELLEPNERKVAEMLASGMSNEQIARRMGFKDKRTISRINGQIYSLWGLNDTSADEKVARTRAAIIVRENRFLVWDEEGNCSEES